MMILKCSPHGNFQVRQIGPSLALCEALKDRYHWGNATETEPAFLAYLGCSNEEVPGYLNTLKTFYRCQWCEVRRPKYLKDFEAEIKIRGLQRKSDDYAFGLDYLIDSQLAKDSGMNWDPSNDYATGVMSS